MLEEFKNLLKGKICSLNTHTHTEKISAEFSININYKPLLLMNDFVDWSSYITTLCNIIYNFWFECISIRMSELRHFNSTKRLKPGTFQSLN